MRLNTLKTALLAAIVTFGTAQIASADTSIGGTDKAGGTIKGTVVFLGKGRKGKEIKMKKDPNCVKIWKAKGEKPRSETYVFGKEVSTGKVALTNVFVSVTKGISGKFRSTNKPLVDQLGCLYTPHVSGVMTDDDVTFKNSDATTHNVKSAARKNKAFNEVTIAGGKFSKTFKKEEVLAIACDVHAWMKGYIHVVKHPFFAVTGEAGTFELKGLPDGDYEVTVWHEFKKFKAVAETINVSIKGGNAVEANFEYAVVKRKK